MNSVLYIHGQHEGSFNIDADQLNSLGIVLKAFNRQENVGCDDKIDSIQITEEWVILFTTNGVEILHAFDDNELRYTSTNTESGEEKTFNDYRSAYEYQFIEENDVICDKIETIIDSLNDIKKELTK
jgi:hypothetical protein